MSKLSIIAIFICFLVLLYTVKDDENLKVMDINNRIYNKSVDLLYMIDKNNNITKVKK